MKSPQVLSRVARWHREGPAGDAVAVDTVLGGVARKRGVQKGNRVVLWMLLGSSSPRGNLGERCDVQVERGGVGLAWLRAGLSPAMPTLSGG